MHALVTRGGWDREGVRTHVPFVDGEVGAVVFRPKVFACLKREGLLTEERARVLLSRRHSGFSVHTSVTILPDDGSGLERLHVDGQARAIAYARRPGPGICPPPRLRRWTGAPLPDASAAPPGPDTRVALAWLEPGAMAECRPAGLPAKASDPPHPHS